MEENTNTPEQTNEQQPVEQTHQAQVPNTMAQALPNATGVLVMGIISIAVCWCYGIVGIALGVIALVLAGKANALYNENPDAYTESSYKNMKAGKICALIGTILSSLYIVYIIVVLLIYGAALTSMPWDSFNF